MCLHSYRLSTGTERSNKTLRSWVSWLPLHRDRQTQTMRRRQQYLHTGKAMLQVKRDMYL